MKIGRFSDGGDPFWAVVDLEARTIDPVEDSIGSWGPIVCADGPGALTRSGAQRPLDGLAVLAPVEESAKVICLGATYAKHVTGLGVQSHDKPAGFWKHFDALVGPEDEIVYPEISEGFDFEVELVMIVGDTLDPGDPERSILGYTVGNDTSLRDHQFGGSVTGMDMFTAKSAYRSAPLGPWIVTRDELGDGTPDLGLTLSVNGETRQSARTSEMSFGVDMLLAWADARTPLRAGDVVFTGTPEGVGHEDGRYLQPGDVVEATIERLGTQRNTIGQRTSSTGGTA